MTIMRNGISGCCVSANFYNLGGAHGQERYKSVDDFADRLLTLGYSDSNFALTCEQQNVERGYLESCGFKQLSKTDRIYTHFGSITDLSKALDVFRASKLKRYEEKLKAQQKQREEALAERAKKLEEFKKLGIEKVTTDEVKDALYIKNRGLQSWCRERFGFILPNHTKDWSTNSEIARAINYRLIKSVSTEIGEDGKT